jgi:hypothetical protein
MERHAGYLNVTELISATARSGVGTLDAFCDLGALPAFGAVGAGFSVIIPLVFGSAGRVENISPGRGIATVTGVAYVGFIVGPPAIGFVAQILTLRYALGIVVLCCVISALLSSWVAPLKGPVGQGPGPELY